MEKKASEGEPCAYGECKERLDLQRSVYGILLCSHYVCTKHISEGHMCKEVMCQHCKSNTRVQEYKLDCRCRVRITDRTEARCEASFDNGYCVNRDSPCPTVLNAAVKAFKDETVAELSLSSYFITKETAQSMAAELATSKTLTSLQLRICAKGRVDTEVCKSLLAGVEKNSTLTALMFYAGNLSTEGVRSIAAVLEKNNTLTKLDLDSNRFGAEGARLIAAALEKNNTLTTLNIGRNGMGAEGARSIAAALEKNKTLATLNLGDNDIGEEGARSIATAVEKNSALTTLLLCDNTIGKEGFIAIAAALEKNHTLTTLDLNRTRMDAEGARAIAAALEKNRTLATLNLEDTDIGTEGARSIAAALEKNNALTILDLSGNQIGTEGTKAIAFALEKNNTLTTLDLSGNAIGTESAKLIATALGKNNTLTELNLGLNKIGTEGTILIAAALEKNCALTTLYLDDNEIGTEGAKSLASALEKNCTLTTLDLNNNEIGTEGAKSLASALEKNCTLTTLNLNTNKIGTEGAKSTAAALEKNCTLIKLNLSRNDIDAEGTKAIAFALEKNNTLTTLDLSENKIGTKGIESIAAALEKNNTITELYFVPTENMNYESLMRITHKIGFNKALSKGKKPTTAAMSAEEQKTKFKGLSVEIAKGRWFHTDILDGTAAQVAQISPDNCDVFLVSYPDGHKEVLKIESYDKLSAPSAEAILEKQFALAKQLGEVTPYVVKPLKFCKVEKTGIVYSEILFEYTGDSLDRILSTHKGDDAALILIWANQSLLAMKEAEKLGVVHGDLRPENMMFKDGTLKIIDFGFGVMVKSRTDLLESKTCAFYTRLYSPPEVLKKESTINFTKVDVYCWGMTFYRIITAKTTDELSKECELYKQGTKETYDAGFLQVCRDLSKSENELNQKFAPLLEAALAYEPSKRPTFAELQASCSAIKLGGSK